MSKTGAVVAPPPPPPRSHWAYWLIAAGTAVALALAVKGTYSHTHAAPKLTQKYSIIVASFTNTTGNPNFDGTLGERLSTELRQSPLLSLVSSDEVAWALQMMHEPPGSGLTGELARAVCRRIGSVAVIEGSVASVGPQYLIGLRAVGCRTGQVLAQEQVTAAGEPDIPEAVTRAGAALRGKLGTALPLVEKSAATPAQVTAGSL